MLGTIRFYGTVALAALALALLLPFHLAAVVLSGRSCMAVAQLWQRLLCRLAGIRVTITGAPANERPLLLLANHSSWLDIPVLAGAAPVSFIAKQEIARWPGISLLAKAQRTVFVDRRRRAATGAHAGKVASRLSRGDIMVLFAEGTAGDGNKVLPFRSALVGAAQMAIKEGGAATVQPVAIAYPKMLGLPLGRQHRPLVAWYGGIAIGPHLRHVLSQGGIDVHVVFGPARKLSAGDDRKAVTQEAGEMVRRTVAALNAGRSPEEVAALATGCGPQSLSDPRRGDPRAEAAE